MRVTCSGVAKLEPSLFLAAITCALWAAEMVWRRPFLHGSVQPKPQKKGKHGRSVVSRLEAPMAASNEFQRSRNDGPMVFAGAAGAFPTLDLGVGVEAAAGEASAFGLFAPAPLPDDGGEAVCGARLPEAERGPGAASARWRASKACAP